MQVILCDQTRLPSRAGENATLGGLPDHRVASSFKDEQYTVWFEGRVLSFRCDLNRPVYVTSTIEDLGNTVFLFNYRKAPSQEAPAKVRSLVVNPSLCRFSHIAIISLLRIALKRCLRLRTRSSLLVCSS
jgi:hypothetical protein